MDSKPRNYLAEQDRIINNVGFQCAAHEQVDTKLCSGPQEHKELTQGLALKTEFNSAPPVCYFACNTTKGQKKSGVFCLAFTYIERYICVCLQITLDCLCPLRKQLLESKQIPYPVVLLNLPVTGET